MFYITTTTITTTTTLRDIKYGGLAVTCIDTVGSLTGKCGRFVFVFVASLSSGSVLVVASGVP